LSQFDAILFSRRLARGCLLALCAQLAWAEAQSQRDPTVPPAEAGLASTAVGTSSANQASGSMSVIVREGRPYLVAGTRLYAQGQKLGAARIDRISETEIWLREGGVLRKVPLFAGIQRHTVTLPLKIQPHDARKKQND
jgi:hypothetical protein